MRHHLRFPISVLAVFVCLATLLSVSVTGSEPQVVEESAASAGSSLPFRSRGGVRAREFLMGFTPFPANPSDESHRQAYQVAGSHGELVAYFVQDGIPWDAALRSADVQTYPMSLRSAWSRSAELTNELTPNHVRYLAINPISNLTYEGLAMNWGQFPNEPLYAPWDSYDFAHPDVKIAVLNYALAAIAHFRPQYMALGIESNVLMSNRLDLWASYVELHSFLYLQLKQRYPEIKFFPTLQYEHLLGLHKTSADLAARFADQDPDFLVNRAAELAAFGDLLAISTYPHLVSGLAIGPDYFHSVYALAERLNVPIAIEQSGFSSQDIYLDGSWLAGSESYQSSFLNFVLREAYNRDFAFVVNFVPQDYGLNYGDSAGVIVWAFTGLFRLDGSSKPALSVWDSYRRFPLSRSR